MMRAHSERNGDQAPADNESAERAAPSDKSINKGGSPDIGAPRTRESRAEELRDAAARYHELGFNIVTIGGNKRPNVGSWKQYTQTRQAADEIDALPFKRAYGIAGLCGAVSGGIVCLDFDSVEGDKHMFLRRVLESLDLQPDYSWAVMSPNGAHVWLYVDGLESLLEGKGKLVGTMTGCDHVELRFDGHYTMLPPSHRQDGGHYVWAYGEAIPAKPPAHVSHVLVESLADWPIPETPTVRDFPHAAEAPEAWLSKALAGEYERVASAAEGQRNDTLFKAACALGGLVHLGLDEQQAIDELFGAARSTGLSDEEIAKTISNGLDRGKSSPRPGPVDPVARFIKPKAGYPLHALPEPERSFVAEAAECIGCPPEMVAVPLIGYAAATIGTTRRIQIKEDYVKSPVLWLVVVGAPGTGKSPGDAQARQFVDRLQADAMKAWRAAYHQWQEDKKAWEAAGEEAGPKPEEPKPEHFYTTDVTLEALAPMLEGSSGVAVAFDEIVGWIKSMDNYAGKSGRDRAQYMSLWAERPLKIDRKRDVPILVEHPMVCVIGGVQPDMLFELTTAAGREDGFIDRFLWTWPEQSLPGWSEAVVSEKTKTAMAELFGRLRSGEGEVVRLSAVAKTRWVAWYEERQLRLASAKGPMKGILSKADVHLARLTLVLHVLEHEQPTLSAVSEQTMESAIALIEYHLGQAERVVDKLSHSANEPRRGQGATRRQRLMAVLSDAGGPILASDIAKKLGGHDSAAERNAELQQMLYDGLVTREMKAPGPDGGRPGECWRLLATHERENQSAA